MIIWSCYSAASVPGQVVTHATSITTVLVHKNPIKQVTEQLLLQYNQYFYCLLTIHSSLLLISQWEASQTKHVTICTQCWDSYSKNILHITFFVTSYKVSRAF